MGLGIINNKKNINNYYFSYIIYFFKIIIKIKNR